MKLFDIFKKRSATAGKARHRYLILSEAYRCGSGGALCNFLVIKNADKRTVKRKTGDAGEELAVKYLKENFYRVRERNWRFGRNEIDIIAERNNVIIFIEVKTTSSDVSEQFRLPSEAVTREKQRNIINGARVYMGRAMKDKIANYTEGRFDVIEVYLNRDTPEINHIENAFYVEKGNKRKWKT